MHSSFIKPAPLLAVLSLCLPACDTQPNPPSKVDPLRSLKVIEKVDWSKWGIAPLTVENFEQRVSLVRSSKGTFSSCLFFDDKVLYSEQKGLLDLWTKEALERGYLVRSRWKDFSPDRYLELPKSDKMDLAHAVAFMRVEELGVKITDDLKFDSSKPPQSIPSDIVYRLIETHRKLLESQRTAEKLDYLGALSELLEQAQIASRVWNAVEPSGKQAAPISEKFQIAIEALGFPKDAKDRYGKDVRELGLALHSCELIFLLKEMEEEGPVDFLTLVWRTEKILHGLAAIHGLGVEDRSLQRQFLEGGVNSMRAFSIMQENERSIVQHNFLVE